MCLSKHHTVSCLLGVPYAYVACPRVIQYSPSRAKSPEYSHGALSEALPVLLGRQLSPGPAGAALASAAPAWR